MRTTASKVGLLERCQWWAKPEAEWSDTTSEAADRGTRFHRAIAGYVATGQVPILEEDIAAIFAVAMRWVDMHGRDCLEAEVAFAWSPITDTAERIPGVERDYQAGAGRLCGTDDLIEVDREAKRGYVWDWKTGDASNAGPQIRALGLMLARAEGLDVVEVAALEVAWDGVRVVCHEVLDAFALSAIAGQLAGDLTAVALAEPQPGPHCGDLYCPARATCPAIRERIADIVPAAELVRHRWGVTIQSADHAAWLYNQAKAVESAAKLVKDAVKAYVPPEGLTLEDGSVMAEGTREMSRFDKDRAIALIRALGATDEQIEGLTRKVTESSGLRISGGAAKPRKRRAA